MVRSLVEVVIIYPVIMCAIPQLRREASNVSVEVSSMLILIPPAVWQTYMLGPKKKARLVNITQLYITPITCLFCFDRIFIQSHPLSHPGDPRMTMKSPISDHMGFIQNLVKVGQKIGIFSIFQKNVHLSNRIPPNSKYPLNNTNDVKNSLLLTMEIVWCFNMNHGCDNIHHS